jgi:hypothetical protein
MKTVTQFEAEGKSQAKKLMTDAQVETYTLIQDKQAQAYYRLKTDLNLTNPELIQYLQI